MPILQITTDFAGQVGVSPRLVRLLCDDDYADVISSGYLNSAAGLGTPILPTDFVFVSYSGGWGSFNPTIVGTNITLSPTPAVAGDGPLILVGNANAGGATTTISNKTMGQATVVSIPDPGQSSADFVLAPNALVSGNLNQASGTQGLVVDSGIAANKVVTSALTNPDVVSDLIWVDVPCSAAALASAGKVNIQVSSGSKQYVVRDLKMNLSTGLSGGSGNRLLSVSDGTLVFNSTGITASLLGTAINTVWGGTGNPLSAIALDTPSTAGATIFAQYIGGSTDYTTGTVIISVQLQRVA